MIGYFVYGGKCSKDYGLYISGGGTFNAPERDVELVEVPGRNGSLVLDNGRFKNITVNYPAFIRHKFKDLSGAAREWLLQTSGYVRLEDSYNPEYYRLARFGGPLDFDTRVLNRSGECTLAFDCKPQRYLLEGEITIDASGSIQMFNPTPFPALPLIRVYGMSGTLMVGDVIVRILDIPEYIDIDCELMNAYKGMLNCNSKINAQRFPVLPVGQTGIAYEGNISHVQIKPRWWTI